MIKTILLAGDGTHGVDFLNGQNHMHFIHFLL